MNILRILRLGALVAFPLCSTSRVAEGRSLEPVAIVYSLMGEASLTSPGAARRPGLLFDRLPAGTTAEVGPGSRLRLAFADGLRYELGERSQVTLGPRDLATRTGPVRPLPAVPPLPRLMPIAESDRPGPRAGAVRIRRQGIDCLSPREGAATRAGATVLRFVADDGAANHQVEVEDLRGSVIYNAVTENRTVNVPAGTLQPGTRYRWTVKALDGPGPVVRGETDFITLSRRTDAAREKLRKAVEAAGDSDSRTLLIAVDHSLDLASEMEPCPESPDGVVIERVSPASPAQTAGLQPGDVILAWSCAASPPALPESSSGSLRSPYDLLPLEREQAPRRTVTLQGKHGDRETVWTFSAGEWGIEARPVLSAARATLYREGKARLEAGDLAAAERSWRAAADSARISGDDRLAAWFLERLARKLAAAGQWPEADAVYGEALAALEEEGEKLPAVYLLGGWGKTFERRAAWDAAVERYQKALALARLSTPKSLTEALMLNALGIVAAKRGDYPAADALLQQALAIREELAPGTAEITGSLNNLGTLARRRGDLAKAEEYLTRGEELQRRLAPESADHALFFQNLGNLAHERGDLERAESFHRQALVLFEKAAPNGDGVVDSLGNLANVLIETGDLTAADDLLHRSLALQEGRAADDLEVSRVLMSLGNLASRRGDLEGAEAHYRRAVAVQEKLSPDGLDTAASLGNLGIVAALQGDFATARSYLQRALAIKEKLVPGGLDVAAGLERLGHLEMDSGDLLTAEKLLRRALTIFETEAPESLWVSYLLRDLGEVAARRGRLTEALSLHHRALSLRRKLVPESTGEAEALHLLGLTERRAGQAEEGTRDLCRAIDILDRQRARIGETQEVRTSFEATLGDYYYACLEGLVQLGQRAEAFHTLERGRARSFLALLAQRDLRLPDLPPEQAAERRRVDAEYDRVQSQLAHLGSSRDDAEIERLTGALRDLRARQEEILARIRRESPRSAALQDPHPLALDGVRAVLDPGTALLEYAVGPERSWLFVVQSAGTGGSGLSVFKIPAGEKALREEVESFRRLLERPGSDRAALQARARRLYRLLVQPAEARIARAGRILVSPDGPLHTLPFAALMRGDHYLVEWKAIHSVLSASVYAELVRSRPARRVPGEERLAAFGDPVYPQPASVPDEPEIRESLRRGLLLKPLPSTREEVKAIAALYPQTQAYLGPDATEEKAKSLGPEAHLVHFACHGVIDERFPLNSALALSLPEHQAEGQDNGLLQAWEILESVRLDADLVTLSACDTALGKEMGGEGLVGLTRAFQFAGARSVLASLWGISDISTARFMKRFYGYLRSGKSKDEALRAAQIDQVREKSGSSHPFHWAAFELFGDWR